jgi:hypothetical protein
MLSDEYAAITKRPLLPASVPSECTAGVDPIGPIRGTPGSRAVAAFLEVAGLALDHCRLSGNLNRQTDCLFMDACCRIGLAIPDTQHETPRGVGKGRLLTHCSPSRLAASGPADDDYEAPVRATPGGSSSAGMPCSAGHSPSS